MNWNAWKPCENCISCGNCESATSSAEWYPCDECISEDTPMGLIQASMKGFCPVGFCRHCGRPLTAAARERLEKQLRAMGECMEHDGGAGK